MHLRFYFSLIIFFLSLTAASASNPMQIAVQKEEIYGLGSVPRDHWAYDAAKILIAAKIMDGSVAGRLEASNGVTRYEFALWTIEILNSRPKNYLISRDSFKAAVQTKIGTVELIYVDSTGKERKFTSADCADLLFSMAQEFSSELYVLSLPRIQRR